MEEKDRTTLKSYFQKGNKPTEQQFVQMIDSFINKMDDKITIKSSNVGIGEPNPKEKLEVNGTVKATEFIGQGAMLTNLDATQITLGRLPKDRIPDIISVAEVQEKKNNQGLKLFANTGNGIFIQNGGNVGIGTTTPKGKLAVHGDLRLGEEGSLFALGALQNFRLIAGRVDAKGAPLSGTGFTSQKAKDSKDKELKGIYTITFDEPFQSIPIVITTVERNEELLPKPLDLVALVEPLETSFVTTVTYHGAGTLYDAKFHFIALGER